MIRWPWAGAANKQMTKQIENKTTLFFMVAPLSSWVGVSSALRHML
jgi:hypothetical protein